MPSVRIRRNSQYTSLIDEDGVLDSSRRHPRSRTVTSIYRNSEVSARDTSHPVRQTSISFDQNQGEAAGPRVSVRPTSKVAETILYGSDARSPQYVRERHARSRGSSNDDGAQAPFESTRRHGMIFLEESDADGVATNGGAERVALGRSLSLSSDSSDEWEPRRSSTEHEDDIVEHLDVIDPEVSTVSNLTNAANSILIPPIGIYSRKPVVVLPRAPIHENSEGVSIHEDDLDRHVEEVLSKRDRIRRVLRGVWTFVKTPLGIATAIYGFCVVFWGSAIVLFLTKMINLHDPIKQGFWVEVSSQVENALFTVTGIGLIPWRVVDTYRIIRIWRYKRLTRKLRKMANLPELYDEDDLPDPSLDPNYVHVLTEKQERDLHHQQRQFAKSQTWYRPHGTPTHRAFPIETALLICCFNDGNSVFQIILCVTMWGLNRFERPAWSTGILIPAAFLCGIASAVYIWRGGQKTKRTKEVEEKLRLALTIERNPDKFRLVDARKSGSRQSIVRASAAHENARRSYSNSQDYETTETGLRQKTDRLNDGAPSIFVDEKMEVPQVNVI